MNLKEDIYSNLLCIENDCQNYFMVLIKIMDLIIVDFNWKLFMFNKMVFIRIYGLWILWVLTQIYLY